MQIWPLYWSEQVRAIKDEKCVGAVGGKAVLFFFFFFFFFDKLAKTTCFYNREECRQNLSVFLVIQVFDRFPNS